MSVMPVEHSSQVVPQTVLVVDDEPVSRASMAARLKRLGYRVLQAEDGAAGLALLRQERPELTILDWMMPEMDGYEATRLIRQQLKLELPVIAMTAHAMQGIREECLQYGMD